MFKIQIFLLIFHLKYLINFNTDFINRNEIALYFAIYCELDWNLSNFSEKLLINLSKNNIFPKLIYNKCSENRNFSEIDFGDYWLSKYDQIITFPIRFPYNLIWININPNVTNESEALHFKNWLIFRKNSPFLINYEIHFIFIEFSQKNTMNIFLQINWFFEFFNTKIILNFGEKFENSNFIYCYNCEIGNNYKQLDHINSLNFIKSVHEKINSNGNRRAVTIFPICKFG